jgi:hypothetical protein
VTRDDNRKLIGGYATGTLTESERKLLFEAALDDQDLFDELAREQALKEMLDEPGAKSRLISRLADAQPALAWWRRPVAWSAAAMLATAAVTILWLRPGKPEMDKPVQYAKLQPAPVPASTPPAVAEMKPANEPAKPPAPAPPPLEKRAEARRDVSGSADAPTVAEQNAVKEDPSKQEADKKETASPEKDAAQRADAEQKAKTVEQLASAGRQFAEPSQSSQNAQVTVQASPAQVAPQAPGFQQSNGFGGGGAARVSGLAAKRSVAPARFAFDYSIEPDRLLVIKALAAGYLSVSSPSLIFPQTGDGHVIVGSITRIAIPVDVQNVVVVFSASVQNAKTVLTDAVSSVRDSRTGTVEDPSPSANSKLAIQLKIQP